MEYIILKKSDYAGKIYIRNYNATMHFYTKKQMKMIYPNRNYRIVGEVGNKTGIQCGEAENLDGQPLPVYKEKTHNPLTESVIGYTAVDDNIFLCIVKNMPVRVFLFLFLFAILSDGIATVLYHQVWFGFG